MQTQNQRLLNLGTHGMLVDMKCLHITLVKVKAHSNDSYNDRADILAKEALDLDDPIIVNHNFLSSSLGLFSYNSLSIVDRNLPSKRFTSIDLSTTTNTKTSKSPSKTAQSTGTPPPNGSTTILAHTVHTSELLSNSLLGHRIKSLTFNLPTGDIQRNIIPHSTKTTSSYVHRATSPHTLTITY